MKKDDDNSTSDTNDNSETDNSNNKQQYSYLCNTNMNTDDNCNCLRRWGLEGTAWSTSHETSVPLSKRSLVFFFFLRPLALHVEIKGLVCRDLGEEHIRHPKHQ